MKRKRDRQRHELTIRYIGASFLSLVFVLVSVCTYSYIRAKQVQNDYSNKVLRSYQRLELVNSLLNNQEQSQQLLRTYVTTQDVAIRDSLHRAFLSAHVTNDAAILELSKLVEQPKQLRTLQGLMQDLDKHQVHIDRLLKLLDSKQPAAAEAYAMRYLMPFYKRHQATLISLSNEATASARQYTAEFVPAVSTIVNSYALLLLLAVGCTIWAGYTLGKVFKHLHQENKKLNEEVAERKSLQQALLDSQEQYKRLFNQNPVPMWVYDQNSLRFLEVNQAAIQGYGYSREEFMNMTLLDIRPADELDKFKARMSSIDKSADAASSNYIHKRKDGYQFKVELKSHALPAQDDVYPRLVVAVNVQEREEAILQLERNEKLLREVSSSLPGAVFQYQMESDYSFSFPYISYGALNLCGVTPEEVYQNPKVLYANLHPDDAVLVEETTLASYQNLTPWECELRVWQPDQNKYRWVRGHSLPSAKGNGTVIWNGTFIDITKQKEAQEQLRSSKANMRALLDSSPQAIYLLDGKRKVVAFNKIARSEVKTYSLRSLKKGMDMLELIDSNQHEQFIDNHNKALQGLTIQYEQGSSEYWHEITFKPVFDASGQVINVTLSILNSTEQKKIFETIKKNEAQLSKAQRIAKIGSWEYDLQKDLLTMSRTLYDIYKLPHKHYVPTLQSLVSRAHPEDKDEAQNLINKAIEAKEDTTLEHRIIMDDGSIKYLSHITEIVCDEVGKPIFVSGTTQDITERKLAEQETMEAKNLLQSTIENIPELIFSADTNFTITYVSPQCKDITGYPESWFLGKKEGWLSVIHANDRNTLLEEVLPKVVNGAQQQHEVRIVNSNKEVKWVMLRMSPKKDEKGNVIRIDGSASDMTQYKETEVKRLKLTEQLLQQNQNLQQFAYIVSHNLRAPVANLLGLVSIYDQTNPSASKNEKIVDNLIKSAQLLDSTIRDLNELLTIRSQVEIPREIVNFKDTLESVLASLHGEIEQSGAIINYDFSKAPNALAIRSYVQSIFYNLVSNAIKFRKPDQKLHICINSFSVNNYLCLSIRDNGLGIDLEKQNGKVFGLYKRFHHKIEGKGIGLHLVKTQAELLGGKVEVESQLSKGTTFHVYLKLQKQHEHLEESSFD